MLPPIQVEYYLSAGKWTLKSIVFPDKEWIPLQIRSAMFLNKQFPPIK